MSNGTGDSPPSSQKEAIVFGGMVSVVRATLRQDGDKGKIISDIKDRVHAKCPDRDTSCNMVANYPVEFILWPGIGRLKDQTRLRLKIDLKMKGFRKLNGRGVKILPPPHRNVPGLRCSETWSEHDDTLFCWLREKGEGDGRLPKLVSLEHPFLSMGFGGKILLRFDPPLRQIAGVPFIELTEHKKKSESTEQYKVRVGNELRRVNYSVNEDEMVVRGSVLPDPVDENTLGSLDLTSVWSRPPWQGVSWIGVMEGGVEVEATPIPADGESVKYELADAHRTRSYRWVEIAHVDLKGYAKDPDMGGEPIAAPGPDFVDIRSYVAQRLVFILFDVTRSWIGRAVTREEREEKQNAAFSSFVKRGLGALLKKKEGVTRYAFQPFHGSSFDISKELEFTTAAAVDAVVQAETTRFAPQGYTPLKDVLEKSTAHVGKQGIPVLIVVTDSDGDPDTQKIDHVTVAEASAIEGIIEYVTVAKPGADTRPIDGFKNKAKQKGWRVNLCIVEESADPAETQARLIEVLENISEAYQCAALK